MVIILYLNDSHNIFSVSGLKILRIIKVTNARLHHLLSLYKSNKNFTFTGNWVGTYSHKFAVNLNWILRSFAGLPGKDWLS